MTPDAQRRRGVRQVLIADGLLEGIVGQANPDKDVTFHWGEPDDDGNWMPVIQTTPKKVALPSYGQQWSAKGGPLPADVEQRLARGDSA